MNNVIQLSLHDADDLGIAACLGAGADARSARALMDATLSAEQFGRSELGFPHLLYHLQSLRAGRINGTPRPRITVPLPSMVHSDADRGVAQLGFDLAFDEIVARSKANGISIFTQRNSYTAGELGYYVRRLAGRGLISLAGTNGPALMAATAGGQRVYCTNPMAFAAPLGASRSPLVIDQSSSETAYVNIVKAARDGDRLAEGWAVDASGNATTDPSEALSGALLPFGGRKGANVALMIEVLAAGLSGASWSTDAHDFETGSESPDAGLTIISIAPEALDHNFEERYGAQIAKLSERGVYIPGSRAGSTPAREHVTIDASVFGELRTYSQSEE